MAIDDHQISEEHFTRDMENSTDLRNPQYKVARQALLGMMISLILIYAVFLIWLPVVGNVPDPVYTVPIFAAYNIIEVALLFGCNQFSFCTMLTFRIICTLYDVSCFITFAVFSSNSYKYPAYECTESSWYKYCRSYMIASCFFFGAATCLEIAIMMVYSRLPRHDCCCPYQNVAPAQVIIPAQTVYQTRPVVQVQTIPTVQTIQTVQQPVYQTYQSQQVPRQPVQAVPPAGSSPANDLPPAYDAAVAMKPT